MPRIYVIRQIDKELIAPAIDTAHRVSTGCKMITGRHGKGPKRDRAEAGVCIDE